MQSRSSKLKRLFERFDEMPKLDYTLIPTNCDFSEDDVPLKKPNSRKYELKLRKHANRQQHTRRSNKS